MTWTGTAKSLRLGVGAAALALACGVGPELEPEPLVALRAFIDASQRGDCDAVWELLPEANRENARRWAGVKSSERGTDVRPEELYCEHLRYHRDLRDLVVVSEGPRRAEITGALHTPSGFLIPGFFPTRTEAQAIHFTLLREQGSWRLERPPVRVREATRRVYRFGDVVVRRRLGGNPEVSAVYAQQVSNLDLDALEAVLLDPATWAPLLPGVERGRTVGEPSAEGLQRVALELEGGRALEVGVRTYGHPVQETIPWTTVQFNNGDPDRDTTLFTGHWKLHTRDDPPRWTVELALLLAPAQWPEGLAEQRLAPEVMADALRDLLRRAGGEAPADMR